MALVGRALLFEKYLIDKDDHVTRVDQKGRKISCENLSKLKADFFSGSVAITRDTNHRGWIHRCIYIGQRIHAFLFGRTQGIDYNLCHSVILMRAGKKTLKCPYNSFVVSHADEDGIVREKKDYLREKNLTELVIYRPVEKEIRDLCVRQADINTFVVKERKRTIFSPVKKAVFSIGDVIKSFFYNRKHEVCGRKKISADAVKRTSQIIADFLLEQQMQDDRGAPQSFFCSGYVTSILQGVFLRNELKNLSTAEICEFVQQSAGPALSREQLALKVQESILKESPKSSVAHALFLAYQQNKFVRYNGRFVSSVYLARALDKLLEQVQPLISFSSRIGSFS